MNPDALMLIFAIIGACFIVSALGWLIVLIVEKIRDYIHSNRDEYITVKEHKEHIKVLNELHSRAIENMNNEEKSR